MENRKAFDLQTIFGRDGARNYDQNIRRRILGYESLHQATDVIFESQLPDEANILVAGAGTGYEIALCAEAHPRWQFLGFDPSPDMLALAQSRMESLNLGKRVKLTSGTVHDLPQGSLFDGATALLVMHFIAEDEAKLVFLSSLASHLKSGATFILADMTGRPGSHEFETLFAAWKVHWKKAYGSAIDSQTLEKEFTERRLRKGWIDEAQHLELFKKAGFVHPVRIWSGLLFSAWAMQRG